ncbi:hypothetical protein F4781DRAFT_393828 [Annulohypoxylon bovei var. microspora]|nr:hypothetical protein F4781DRAFT_393828 [Annulohypoxylon bovei var. microspora]
MSAKTTPDASKANGDGDKSSKTWSSEEVAQLLLLIMQEENFELSVKGWNAIGEKAQHLFARKYSMIAIKHQFQRLRRAYMEGLPDAIKNGQSNSDSAKAPAKGQKRAATSVGDNTDDAPKAKKPRSATKAAKDATIDNSNGDEQKPGEAAAHRRAIKKSQAKAGGDKDSHTRKNSQKMAAIESESTSKAATDDSYDNDYAAIDENSGVGDNIFDGSYGSSDRLSDGVDDEMTDMELQAYISADWSALLED